MTHIVHENMDFVDRTVRIILGITLSMSLLFLPNHAVWIATVAFVATYPLVTGLIAIDPIKLMAEKLIFQPLILKKPSPPAVA